MLSMFEYVFTETYFFIFLLAVLFYILQNIKTNKLIALIIICILIFVIYLYLQQVANDKTTNLNYQENTLDDDIKDLYMVLISNQHKFEKAFPGLSQIIMASLQNNVDKQG